MSTAAWPALSVRKEMFGRHIIADLTLPYGEVLLDYLA